MKISNTRKKKEESMTLEDMERIRGLKREEADGIVSRTRETVTYQQWRLKNQVLEVPL